MVSPPGSQVYGQEILKQINFMRKKGITRA